jgi:hypothetical protein
VHDLVSGALEVLVSEGVEPGASEVDGAVDFDDEAPGGAEEVGDVANDDDLATEGDAELGATECGPEELLGECWVVPEMVGLGCELALTLGGLTMVIG